MIERDSATFTPSELSAQVGGPASWISVDGDHYAESVYRDLQTAEATLAPWGVIALVDFVNVNAIGVVERAIRYFAGSNTRLRPFCYCAGKLLLAFEEYMWPCATRRSRRSAGRMNLSEGWITQTLCGRLIWLIA